MNVKTRNIKISVAGREGMLHRVALNHQYHTNKCHKETSTGAQQRWKTVLNSRYFCSRRTELKIRMLQGSNLLCIARRGERKRIALKLVSG